MLSEEWLTEYGDTPAQGCKDGAKLGDSVFLCNQDTQVSLEVKSLELKKHAMMVHWLPPKQQTGGASPGV